MADKNLMVTDGMVVSLDYTLRLQDGQIVDSSSGKEPLEYLHGTGQIIPGLEDGLDGMVIGEERQLTVAPADGYGERDPDSLQTVPSDFFPGDIEVVPGMAIQVRDENDQVFPVYVAEVRTQGVVLDFNHPLAGETLYFDTRVVGVRPATTEELSHGHAHGEGHSH